MEKKKPVKIKLTLAVIIIELFFLVSLIGVYFFYHIANDKDYNETIRTERTVNKKNQDEYKKNNEKNEIKENKTNLTEIEWEEYPKDDNWMEDEIRNSVRKDSTIYKLTRKTLYSLSKNKIELFEKRYYNIFTIGDSTEIVDWNSNYPRYCYPDNEKNDLSAKYTKKITYDIADFNERYYDGYYSLESLVKKQYDSLVVKKDYGHYKNVPKSFYFKIPNMLIMNGNNTSKEDYINNSRAKKIKVTVNKEKEYFFELKDTNKVQVFDIGYKQDNIEKTVNIEVEVLEKYKGENTEDIYISDIQFGIESNIPQGR